MPQKGWVNVGLPEEIIEIIDRVITTQKHGFRSRADLILEGVKLLLQELGEYPPKPRFTHLNVFEDHVTLMDHQLDNIAEIYFQRGKAYCSLCEKHDCEHTQFALSLPKVVKALTTRGWKIEDGKIIKGPI